MDSYRSLLHSDATIFLPYLHNTKYSLFYRKMLEVFFLIFVKQDHFLGQNFLLGTKPWIDKQ